MSGRSSLPNPLATSWQVARLSKQKGLTLRADWLGDWIEIKILDLKPLVAMVGVVHQ